MQLKDQGSETGTYRPPQACLNIFWTLTEGNDETRGEAAVQLVKMIQSFEKKAEREQITTYCINRLVRGLGSGRKFARVGFSTALSLLLRLQSEVKTAQVLACFTEKLRNEHHACSKSEKAALHLGHAFAFSAIIQSGRISKIDGDVLGSIVGELLYLADKRSFLRPVCSKVMENLMVEVSQKSFADHVWPKIRDKLTLGWQGCTLDRISLLLACKEKFPDIVNKKFIKKHWGPSVCGEDNDSKLLEAVQVSMEKSCTLREKIVPHMLNSGRDVLSIWKGIGEKMISSGKDHIVSKHQLVAIELLNSLIQLSDSKKLLPLILEPSVTKTVFMENHSENETLGKILTALVNNLCEKMKSSGGNILSFVKQILEFEGKTEDGAKEGRLAFIHTNNFAKIVSMMEKDEMKQYANILIEYVKGRDDNLFFSEAVQKRKKQLDWCFRQLQMVCCSQTHTNPEIQHLILALFLRNGFFAADKKNNAVLHCDFVDRFIETDNIKKLCESFLFKSLDQLSTLKTDKKKKTKNVSEYTDLLSYLVHYFQSLLSCDDVKLVSTWSEETTEIWKQLMGRVKSLEKTKKSSHPDTDNAFKLLYYYMAFYLLTDAKAASDLLNDLFICHDKSGMTKKTIEKTEEEDPFWAEVLTEILLQLLSFQSHLARVISSMVFKLIVPHINGEAVTLITQVLIPNKKEQNNMFEDNEEMEEEEEDDDDDQEKNGGLLDEDVPSEESSDEDDEDDEKSDAEDAVEDEEKDDDDDEKMDVDEQLRASVKEVLGNAAISDDDDDEEDLPDLSDSEMFKLDEALAEVFRQRKRKMGGKKVKEEKRRELANFRLRVLDLVDVLIKSDRCGDFLLDLLKPLLVLMFSSHRAEEEAACNRAKSAFQQLKTRCKGITDSVHTDDEQSNMFQELMDLARRVNDPSQLQYIASACSLMIKVSSIDCLQTLQETLNNVINKKQSKPRPSFFITLLDTDPVVFQPLCTMLINCIQNDSVKKQCKSMALTLLTSLAKKTNSGEAGSNLRSGTAWMNQAAQVVGEIVLTLDKDSVRGIFIRELFSLTLGLLGRTDVLSVDDFGCGIKEKLLEVKSKMGTDTRRLTNKIVAALDRMAKETQKPKEIQNTKETHKLNGKKRKAEDLESPKSKKKKRKTEAS